MTANSHRGAARRIAEHIIENRDHLNYTARVNAATEIIATALRAEADHGWREKWVNDKTVWDEARAALEVELQQAESDKNWLRAQRETAETAARRNREMTNRRKCWLALADKVREWQEATKEYAEAEDLPEGVSVEVASRLYQAEAVLHNEDVSEAR